MNFRDSLLAVVDAARNVRGPLGLSIQLNQLTIRKRTWSGDYIKEGVVVSDEDTVLPQKYPVRYLTQAQMDGTAGSYETGDVLVDHITPSDGNGAGWTAEQLAPTVTGLNQQVIYLISGSHSGEYELVELRTLRPFTWQLVLRRTLAVPAIT